MADYKPDFRETAKFMQGPEMLSMVTVKAHESIPFAKSISPDAPPYGVGYVSHFEVHASVQKIAGARRAVAELLNTSDYAVEVELGQLGNVSRADTGHHVLARTADHIERG